MKRGMKKVVVWILILTMLAGYGKPVMAQESGIEVSSSQQEENFQEDSTQDEVGNLEESSGQTQEEGLEESSDQQETGDFQETVSGTEEEGTEEESSQTEQETAQDETVQEESVSSNSGHESHRDEEGAESVSSNSLSNETVSSNFLAQAAAEAYTYEPYWPDGNFSNLIIFVDFSDTPHAHEESIWGSCYKEDLSATFAYFNGSEEKPRGMRQYLYQISYGQLRVENIFPQYNGTAIVPYTLSNTAEYYAGNRDAMVEEIIDKINASGQINNKMKLDLYNSDKVLDNLTILVACEEGNSNTLFSGYKTTYAGDKTIGGMLVGNYNLITEMGVYFSPSNSGVIIHEFLHTLGYPDLYHNGPGYPVGRWDIMSSESTYVQYPLAYLRSAYTGWFTIDTVEKSGQYSLYAASETTSETKNRQALILKTDYSDTEFFVVEFRKQGKAYTDQGQPSEEYEVKIPGSGLIVYRVDTSQTSNFTGPPDLIYIFRPGDSYNANGYENSGGDLYSAHLSAETGRTSYGSSDFTKSLSDGAITYADGTNSGIVISNVGSAEGEQITFDITFSEREEGKYWTTYGSEAEGAKTVDGTSCLDEDGSFYHILTKGSASSGTAYFYRQNGSSFTQLATAPSGFDHVLVKYDNSFYTAYLDKNYRAAIARFNGSSWTVVYQSEGIAGGISLTSDSQGVYMAYTASDGTAVYVVKAGAAGAALLGKPMESGSKYAANPSIAAQKDRLVVMYREAFNGNRVVVKQYDRTANDWQDVGEQSFRANSGRVKIHNGTVYMMINGTSFEETDAYLYAFDLQKENGSWTTVGNGAFTSVNILESDFCFVGNAPYIAYTDGEAPYAIQVTGLQEGVWTKLGDDVAKVNSNGLGIYFFGGRLFVTYVNTISEKAFVRTFLTQYTEQSNGNWQLEYGEVKESTGRISGEISHYDRLEKLYEALASLGLSGDAGIRVDYIGQGMPENIPAKLFQFCADKGWQLEYGYAEENGEVQYIWKFSGLKNTEPFSDYPLKLEVRTEGASLAADFTKENYIQLQLLREIPVCNRAELMIYGDKIAEGLIGKAPIYQWNQVGEKLILNGEAQLDKTYGSWFGISLTSQATEYLLTSRPAYGWREETIQEGQGEKEYWVYIDSKSKKKVKGWKTIEGRKCYFGANGYLAEGVTRLGKKLYLFGEYKAGTHGILTGVQSWQKEEYYADKSGVLSLGWKKVNGSWRYYDPSSGARQESQIRSDNWAVVQTDEGEKYFYLIEQKSVARGWKTIQKEKYYFDANGVLQSGFFIVGKNTYYGLSDVGLGEGLGRMLTGEQSIDGNTYYFGKNGVMLVGFQQIDGKLRFFDTAKESPRRGKEQKLTGATAEDDDWYWYTINGEKYCLFRNQRLLKGWNTIAKRRYYFNPDTHVMQTGDDEGLFTLGKKTYYLGDDGVVRTGWIHPKEGVSYYANNAGVLLDGWQKIQGSWYYFDKTTKQQNQTVRRQEDGFVHVTIEGEEKTFYFVNGRSMARGWRTINGIRCYFDSVSGERKTGFFQSGKNRYYYSEDGTAQNGWWKGDDGNQYYFRQGKAVKGWQTIEGGRYYFDTDGIMQTLLTKAGKASYFLGIDGRMRMGFIRYGNNTYYFHKKTGKMQKGWQTIDGERYYFDANGHMYSGFITLGKKTYYLDERPSTYGRMLTGRQVINGYIYYFSSRGVLLRYEPRN